MKWTKETALRELDQLVGDTAKLEKATAFTADHVRWHQRVVSFLEDVFGGRSRLFLSFVALTWRREGEILVGGFSDPEGSYDPEAAVRREHHKAYLRHLDTARGLLLAARDQLERKELSDVYEGKDTGSEASLVLKVLNLLESKLRKVVRQAPQKEKDVQDALESLFVGAEVAYSREADSIEYSTKTYTPDFSVSRADLSIEVKLCNREGREKEIIAEINDDILAYKTKFGNIIFVVYDVGLIRDVERFIGNFGDQNGVIVKVVKH